MIPYIVTPTMARMAAVVARDRELSSAESFLEGADSKAGVLVLEGEAGIGKTTIWWEVVRRAEEQGFRVLSCRPTETETKFALSALVDLLESVSEKSLALLPDPQRRALEVALLRVEPGPEPIEPRLLATAFRSLLEELSGGGRVLVAVDDVQWLDEASASVIQFALRRLDGAPIGWLFARRPVAEPRLVPEEIVSSGSVTHVGIRPLNLAALQHVLKDRFEDVPTRPALVRIHRASGGNPLHAIEVTREVLRAGDLAALSIPVPDDIRQLILQRIERLPQGSRDALLLASALFEPSTALIDEGALGPAEEADLVHIDGNGRVVFRHPLYASAVYGSASLARRRKVHAYLAGVVDGAEERARHLSLATVEPDERVASAIEEGAVAARTRGAWESSAELLQHAARLTPADLAETGRMRTMTAAEHHARSGGRTSGRALLEELLSGELPSELRAHALWLLGEISYHDENFSESERLFHQALEHTDEPRLASTIRVGLSYVHASQMNFPQGSVDAHRGLELAERIADRSLTAQALTHCAMLDFLCGLGVDWDKVDRALALEEDDPLVPFIRRASTLAAFLHLYVGRHAEARAMFQQLSTAAIEAGDESDLAFILIWRSWLETRIGDFGVAADAAEQAASLATLTGSQSMFAWALTQQALVSAHKGLVEETRRYCSEAWEPVQRSGNMLPGLWIAAALGLLESSRGDPEAAWQACEPLTQMIELTGISEPVVPFFLPDAIESLIALDQLDRAEALLDLWMTRAQELRRTWVLATGGRCRALLLATRGDLKSAHAALEEALAEHELIEMPFERARTLLVKGVIERRSKQRARAKASLEEARNEFERLGAPLWAERVRVELARVGLRRSSGAELTASELRVAELAASGLTNREVAAALFISPKTVEANLSKIYRKLNIGSRAELGAYMAGAGQT